MVEQLTCVQMRSDTPLRRWRIVHQLTQEALAQRIGLTQRNLALYEVAVRIPWKYLEVLHALTDIPYPGLVNPRKFLHEYPAFLASGQRPLQGRGWPKGRSRLREPREMC